MNSAFEALTENVRPTEDFEASSITTALAIAILLAGSLLTPSVNAQITSTLSGQVLDPAGLGIAGVLLLARSNQLGLDRYAESDTTGSYYFSGLLAGVYEITVSKAGFDKQTVSGIVMTVNSTVNLNISLNLVSVHSTANVSASASRLETESSSSSTIITPAQIEDMPLNGRNYLDLLQLVAGVTLNRQANAGSDTATPVLGERSGNAQFLIDGLSNSDEVNGGAAAPFDLDSILEFQVITSGYKAELGHGSGGVINVLSKSGTADFHGAVSLFHRNYKLDSSDVPEQKNAPFLLRWDSSAQLSGPVVKDRAFFFVSAERILESRNLNFQFPPDEPSALIAFESPFNRNSKTFDTRLRGKLDQQFGHHRLSEQMNWTNMHLTDFLPLSESTNLPSTRSNLDARHLMLGLSDIALIGDAANPFVLNLHAEYRGEPSRIYAAHPQAGAASTIFNIFDTYTSDQIAGNLGQVVFGPGFSPFTLDQKYTSFGVSLARQNGGHNWKAGLDFERTMASGIESTNISNQLFATISDFNQFGPVDSGINFITYQGGATSQDNRIRLHDNYQGLYGQDDWKLARSLTINYGLRWDYDSTFPNRLNFSPRVGIAWSSNSKTVLRAGWGVFYDRFRVGTARDVPAMGGADITETRYLSFPRLFYGDPSQVLQILALLGTGVPCVSNTLTDSQVAQQDSKCTFSGQVLPFPLYGVDRLNKVVALGHPPIPANAVVNLSNLQQLSGLTAQQFANAGSNAIGRPAGFFTWDPFGHLSTTAVAEPGDHIPVTVDPNFRTPYTRSMQAGIQRELGRDVVVEANYYHRDVYNILGVRNTNLAFIARIPGHTGELQPGTGNSIILGYGPWYGGTYNGASVLLRKRFGSRLTAEGSYTVAHANDDAVANLITDQQLRYGLSAASGVNGPLDSFIGVVPVVTDPISGKNNSAGSFVAGNGNPVPQAGKFYNGPALTSGPSDLSVQQTFLLDGIWNLPRGFSVSGIFRAQSGFRFSAETLTPADVDGDGLLNSLDYSKGRNHFTAPPFVNTDIRFTKVFKIGEMVRLHICLDFFNLFNNANPAAVETLDTLTSRPFGAKTEVLPGREGQVGLRIDF